MTGDIASTDHPSAAVPVVDEERERWPDCNCSEGPFDDEVVYDRNLSPRCPRCNVALGGDPMTDSARAALDAEDAIDETSAAVPTEGGEVLREAAALEGRPPYGNALNERIASAFAPSLFGGRHDDLVGPATLAERDRMRRLAVVACREIYAALTPQVPA